MGLYLNPRQKEYLRQQYDLTSPTVERLLSDLLEFLSQTPEDWVRQRHQELQDRGWPNSLIYRQILEDLPSHRFSSPALSERQIRRIIYG